MMRRLSVTPLVSLAGGVLLLGLGLPAVAQSFLGTGPLRSFVLPTEPRGETPSQPTPEPVWTPPAPPAEVLRHLSTNLAGLRFNGEWAQGEWPVYLTAPQAKAKAQFRLGHLSAISVMPEGSSLTLSVNGALIGKTALTSAVGVANAVFDLPAGLLKPGFNAVRIVVSQRHRVDCSPAATYELWTMLDSASTGLVLADEPARQGYDAIADLAALRPRADGALPIRIATGGKLTPQMMARAVRAAQLAALSGGHLRPVVDFGGAGEQGLDLAIGTHDELRARPELTGLSAVTGAGYGFLPASREHSPVFVVTGATIADIDASLDAWDKARRLEQAPPGTSDGQRVAARLPGFVASGAGEAITLRETGFVSTEFSGRVMRLGVDVTMPMDFLPADYDRMTLNLAGSHSRGLDRDASILVEVNGRTAATQMLSAGTANALDRNQIFLPLRLMRPGQNRVEIVAQTPSSPDKACVPGQARDESRLQILDSSELVLPRVARIGRSPELSLLAAGAFPYAQAGMRPILFVPNPDRQTMAAAATLAARLAVAAGRPIAFDVSLTPPADTADVLMISPAPTLDPALMRAVGLDPEQVKRAWQGQAAGDVAIQAAAGDELAQGCGLPQMPDKARIAALAPASDAAGFGFAGLGLKASLPALPFWERADGGNVADVEALVTPRAALLLAQDFPAKSARHLWTVVTAPSAAALKAGVDCLGRPGLWSQIGGRMSVLRADETVAVLQAGDEVRYVATQGFSIGNQRLVAAGWLSLNPLGYVGLALALVLCLAAATLWLVLNTGRRQE